VTRPPRRSSFGIELGRLLASEHVTYRELSRRTGLAPQTLHRYAMGVRRPDDDTLELIARALGREPDDLLEWRRRRVLERVGESTRLVNAIYRRIA
jgi:transcriptional regulator with XRE-family HTH domain